MEQRLALAVTIGGYADGFNNHIPDARIVDGVSVIAADSGDNVYIQQVASVAGSPLGPGATGVQDLLVADNSSFLNYQTIDGIDGYHNLFVTNGTQRRETLVPSDNPNLTTTWFSVSNEELFWGIGGTIRYTQSDGTSSAWQWNSGGWIGPNALPLVPVNAAGLITVGPGVPAALNPGQPVLPVGHIRPISVTLFDRDNLAEDIGQSRFRVVWSDVPASLDGIAIDAVYEHSDGILGTARAFDNDLRSDVAPASTITFTLPGALAATSDGFTLQESLGVIPGTLSGTLTALWTGNRLLTFDFQSDLQGNVLFNQPAIDGFPDFGRLNSTAVRQVPGSGFVGVTNGRLVGGVLTVDFIRWDDIATAEWTDANGVDRVGFGREDLSVPVAGIAGPVTLSNVRYQTYTRDSVANAATFVQGQTITRDVTVDLLTPGSTVNIDSPIRTSTALRENGALSGGDIDLRATNVNVRATMTAPDRLFVGHSQEGGDRLTLPTEEEYILSPSFPTLYQRPLNIPAQVIVEVDTAGGVQGLVLVTGTGYGYSPANPPIVTIAAPAGGGTRATAIATVGADGRITGFTITNRGSGYGAGWTGVRPTATVSEPLAAADATARVAQINAAKGSVEQIDVLDTGYRYHAPPRIVIDPPSPGTDSRQASARAVIDAQGRLVRIDVVDPGSGYRNRPVVRVQPQSPVAYTETLNFRADVSANIYEMYVGDDLGTDVPRGIVSLTAEGRLSAAGVSTSITGPGAPTTTGQQTFTIDPTGLPAGFNPVGRNLSGFGVRQNTRVLGWNARSNTITVAAGSISTTLSFPSNVTIDTGAGSLYLEATTADVFVEGQVNAVRQTYMLNSDASRSVLAPFVFTTASPITGTQTGFIEGTQVNIGLGNDAPTPLVGATAYNTVDLTTRIASLRTSAAVSQANPRGAFPYELTIRSLSDISIDAVAASSRTITVDSRGDITMTSALDTQGDLLIEARAESDAETANFRVTSPVSTSLGRIAISADGVEVLNSVAVSSAAVSAGRQDILLEARRGDLVMQAGVSAVNDVVLRQSNATGGNGRPIEGEIDGRLARVRAENITVDAEGSVNIRTDAVTLRGAAGTGFSLSELNDITIPLLASGGLVSLEALGVDPGPNGENPRALTATGLDMTQLFVNAPNGSAFVDVNTDQRLILGNALDISRNGVRAAPMTAAGDVVIRSQSGDIVALDAPIGGAAARTVRAVTLGKLPATATYAPGTPGVFPSTFSGSGSINDLTFDHDGDSATPGVSMWGFDASGRRISLAVGDRVLVSRQTDLEATVQVNEERENGVYVVTKVGGGALGSTRWELTRSADTDTAAEALPNTLVRVLEGPLAGSLYSMRYDTAPRTLVEVVSGNVLKLPEFFPAFDLLFVGQAVSGPGIAPNSFISAIDPVQRTVALDVLDPGQAYLATPDGLVAVKSSNPAAGTLTFDPSFQGFANLTIGQAVSGEGIPRNTVIHAIDPTTLTIIVEQGGVVPGVLPESFTATGISVAATEGVTRVSGETAAANAALARAQVGQRLVFSGNGVAAASRIVKDVTTVAGLTTLSLDAGLDATVAYTSVSGLSVATVRFGAPVGTEVAPVADEPDSLDLVGFVNLDALFVGQLVMGPGILPGAVITAIDPVAGRISVTPGALPLDLGPATVRSKSGRSAVLDLATFTDVARIHVGQWVEWLDSADATLGFAFVESVNAQTGSIALDRNVPAFAAKVRFLSVDAVQFGLGGPGSVPVTWNQWSATNVTPGLPDVLTLPTFTAFADLSIGLEVYGPNIPIGARLIAFNAASRQITLDRAPPPGAVTQVAFGIGPTALHPATNVLTLPTSFTHFDRLFLGQDVYGAGIAAGAVITGINPVTRTITLTPGSVAPGRTNVVVAQADATSSPYYPEGYDDWVELDPAYNDFGDVVIGQRAQFFNGTGQLIGSSVVTGVDAAYRTVGFADGALAGIAPQVATMSFLPVASVRFGTTKGVGSSRVDFALPAIGQAPISFIEETAVTNIGTDLLTKTVTYVVSTSGGTNAVTGSLGKMISAYQENDVAETTAEVAVLGAVLTDDGGVTLTLDSLFTAYSRVIVGGEVGGTAYLFNRDAAVLSVDDQNGTVTLAPGSLSSLGRENPERISSVRIPVTTINPEQKTDFRFWAYGNGDIRLTQELPLIVKPMTIDGRKVNGEGLTAVAPAFAGVFVNGQRITNTRAGRLVGVGDQVNGFEVLGQAASGTRIAGVSVGGFTSGSAVKLDSTKDVVLDSLRVGTGLTATTRLPVATGITVTGRTVAIAPGGGQDKTVVRLGDAALTSLKAIKVGQRVTLLNAAGQPVESVPFEVEDVDTKALTITLDRATPDTAVSMALVAENNTILNTFVGGGLGAGIDINGQATRTYVVGTTVGNTSVDNVVGISVNSSVSSPANFIGVDAVRPEAPIVTSAALSGGSDRITVARTLFSAPLIGLSVAGEGLPAGAKVIGIDSLGSALILDKIADRSTSSTVTIGHRATRLLDEGNVVQLDPTVPSDDIFVGQLVRMNRGSGIVDASTIVAIDRTAAGGVKLTLSQPVTAEGSDFVSFASPGVSLRNVVQNNRRGIVLRGTGTRITNTDVINNSGDGIEIVNSGQTIGTQVASGTVSATSGLLLTSWSTSAAVRTVTTPASTRTVVVNGRRTTVRTPASTTTTLTLPATVRSDAPIKAGTRIYGGGIPDGATVAKVVSKPAAGRQGPWTITLSVPAAPAVRTATVSFGIDLPNNGGPARWNPGSAADLASLFVGQSVHVVGRTNTKAVDPTRSVPDYTRIEGIRTENGATPGLLVLSTPLASLPAAQFALAANAEMRMAEVTRESNAFHGNGGLGIRINDGGSQNKLDLNRIQRNRFGITGTGAAATANVRGAILAYASPTSPTVKETPEYKPSTFSKTDRFGNQHGLGTLPGGRGRPGNLPPGPPVV